MHKDLIYKVVYIVYAVIYIIMHVFLTHLSPWNDSCKARHDPVTNLPWPPTHLEDIRASLPPPAGLHAQAHVAPWVPSLTSSLHPPCLPAGLPALPPPLWACSPLRAFAFATAPAWSTFSQDPHAQAPVGSCPSVSPPRASPHSTSASGTVTVHLVAGGGRLSEGTWKAYPSYSCTWPSAWHVGARSLI